LPGLRRGVGGGPGGGDGRCTESWARPIRVLLSTAEGRAVAGWEIRAGRATTAVLVRVLTMGSAAQPYSRVKMVAGNVVFMSTGR